MRSLTSASDDRSKSRKTKTQQGAGRRDDEIRKNSGFGQPPPGLRGNQRTGATPRTTSGGRADTSASGQATHVTPGDYNTGGSIYGSNQWYGQNLGNYGARDAASDPNLFWLSYGANGPGKYDPAGNAGAFYQDTFNPRAMAQAMFPGRVAGTEENLAAQSSVAGALTGSGKAMFVNPGNLVSNIAQALQSQDPARLAQTNPMLAEIISQNMGNPAGQIGDLVNFLGEALKGSMPEDALNAWLSTIGRLGTQFYTQLARNDKNLDASTFARFLTSQLGNTWGL